jgi:hypothetical protein
MNFLTGRSQTVVSGGKFSCWFPITSSIVQGSGIEPTLYITYAGDHKTMSGNNILCKYADDINLIVPENTDVGVDDEFANLINWTKANRLIINIEKKQKKMFFAVRTSD